MRRLHALSRPCTRVRSPADLSPAPRRVCRRAIEVNDAGRVMLRAMMSSSERKSSDPCPFPMLAERPPHIGIV
eukprot:1077836-Prymnesium_polylepis.1